MSSLREQITAYLVTQLDSVAAVKSVTREPKSLEELSTRAMPHVLIETANETRENVSFGGEVRKVANLEVLLNIVVYGNNRDQQRNTVIEAIEAQLDLDSTLGGLAYDSETTEILIREIAEASPHGQAAMIINVKYYYTKGTP
jgi:hypothetical protein